MIFSIWNTRNSDKIMEKEVSTIPWMFKTMIQSKFQEKSKKCLLKNGTAVAPLVPLCCRLWTCIFLFALWYVLLFFLPQRGVLSRTVLCLDSLLFSLKCFYNIISSLFKAILLLSTTHFTIKNTRLKLTKKSSKS